MVLRNIDHVFNKKILSDVEKQIDVICNDTKNVTQIIAKTY